MMSRKFLSLDCLKGRRMTMWLGSMKSLGIFSVRSAYHLAISLDSADRDQAGCSDRADGSRPVLNSIWAAKVPPMVRVFAWRLS
jgi:hypothetical protein